MTNEELYDLERQANALDKPCDCDHICGAGDFVDAVNPQAVMALVTEVRRLREIARDLAVQYREWDEDKVSAIAERAVRWVEENP